MIFFTSDTHFDHAKIIQLEKRPFATIEEMNETLIKNWNETVGRGDVVYHLGDFGFGRNLEPIRERLNGQIILICGNHDRNNLKPLLKSFGAVKDLHGIKIGEHYVALCHYPLQSWNRSHYGSFHLHGHCHGNMPAYGRRMDVGTMCHDWRPVSEEMVINKLKDLPIFANHYVQHEEEDDAD